MLDFYWANIAIIINLVILEGLLSFDNALALAALVKKKIKDVKLQKKALVWGLWGAYIMRVGIIIIGVSLMQYEWVKALAGIYLLYLAVHELFFHKKGVETHETDLIENKKTPLKTTSRVFVMTIIQVELMDLMFSIDSIAVALAISDVKWVLITGAVLGILMMRVAAQSFIKLIDKFPILEKTAFVLVGFAGINVLLKLKDLNLGFMYLTIDKHIPENVFLTVMVLILLGAMLLNKLFPKKFSHS